MKSILAYMMAWLLASTAHAQTAADHQGHAPQQLTPWKEMPTPALTNGYGNSALKITTDSQQAQAYFNQGLQLLHCFWEFEAYRAFKKRRVLIRKRRSRTGASQWRLSAKQP